MKHAFLLGGLIFTGCASRAQHAVALYDAGDYAGAARAADAGLAAHPGDEALWQMRVRAALAQGDGPGLARAYAGYRDARGDDDQPLLRELAVATLGQALASPSAKLKLAAIEAVATAELQVLADQVAERMTDDDDRVAAAAAIAILRGYPQAPQVAGDMLHSEDAEARRIAVDGIGQKVGTFALADLEAAASDGDPRVRRTALRWLGELKAGDAAPLLAQAVRDPDPGVRAAAASALARLGPTPAVGPGPLGELARQALRDPALAVRLAGIELVVAAHGPALRAELATLAADPDPIVATEAAIAAGGGDLAARALDRAATATEPATRAGAANLAVRAVGKPAALAVARKLAADPELAVRLAAARVLAHTGDPAAATAIFLAGLAPTARLDDRLQAAIDLAAQDDARGAQALDAAIRDPALAPAARATIAAAHRTARRITPGLVAALADRSATVRVAAAAAVAVITRRD